ncbi:retromer complex subunit Vps35 [Malassezia caprae]|uniref:Vacuolar protein sorting-associated protein 35 n=1 Tax=Malassezia caprae TaxID=1381934 RepID=A0AAF0J0C7_9BASI|nr:retromer complex subunit Vps35 [Malassezia caprae]
MEEWNKSLTEALNVVKIQGVQMKRYLDTDRVMDALKSASTMLNELRSSALSPKQYYELYMAAFDSLRHLSIYVYDAHMNEKHHLADLYELVQYCGNIVPRLYLMVTVGSVYMSVPDAPIKEIMKDMMEMCRGVQHPTRGLFLRHYLSGTTRDHLPTGQEPGPGGNLNDSISFILANFVEMNKLWVRQQHLGHSREREKREAERRELRILVGTNLVRLSQLDGVTLEIYQKTILPAILEQVIHCKDVIAQEYLMEVIIQVFPDEFHLRTLSLLLSACARLHPKVSIKQIVIALINRLAAYAVRESESETPEERKRQEDEASARLLTKSHEMRQHVQTIHPATVWREIAEEQTKSRDSWSRLASDLGQSLQDDGSNIWGDAPRPAPAVETTVWAEEAEAEAETQASEPTEGHAPQDIPDEQPSEAAPATDAPAGAEPTPTTPRKFRGIPEDVRLFEVFWEQIVLLMRARPDLSMNDTAVLLLSLLNLSLSCYPDRLEYVDQVLGFAISKIQESVQGGQSTPIIPQGYFQSLLIAPINAYVSALTVLAIPNYYVLWAQQQPLAQRAIAQVIVHSILRRETIISTPEEAHGILELCASLVKDKGEAAVANATASNGQGMPVDELAEQQGMLARLVHLFRSDDLDMQLVLLYIVHKHYGEGGESIRFSYPPLITEIIALVRRFSVRRQEKNWEPKMTTLFHFVHQLISTLYHRVEVPELSLRLFLLAAEVADDSGFEEMAYEFYVQSFSIFEESISDSRSQLQAIGLIIGTLYKARVFGLDNYDTLITKAALHAAKLLKRPHQAAAVLMASHLWWQLPGPKDIGEPRFPLVKDGRRVLECLQKTLRIANGCINEYSSVEIFCHALSKYLYFFEQGVEAVTGRYINSLVDLITKALTSLQAERQARSPGWRSEVETSPTWDAVQQHFYNQLQYIQAKKRMASEADTGSVAAPDWASLEIDEALEKMAPS